MEMHKYKTKNHTLKKFIVLLLAGIIAFAGLPMQVAAQNPGTKAYDTNFDWNNSEEDLNEWPLDPNLIKTNAGIGTAGFSYNRFYYNDQGRIVLEIDLSIFPDAPDDESSAQVTFRNQWDFANIFIDPDLVSKIDDNASFFMMSYPAEAFPFTPTAASLSSGTKTGNVYKLAIDKVFPNMPGSDYMQSKLYLVLNQGVTREQLNQDYALELRYTNDQTGQIYDQRGSGGRLVLGQYRHYTPTTTDFDVSANHDDVTLKTIAPFQTASMPGTIPNPILPPNMMRTVGQSVLYDNISGKLLVYYKQAPNHYLYRYYADNGHFLYSWIGIRQVMDSRIYNALKPDENGVVGKMMMLDRFGETWRGNVISDIKKEHFSYTGVTENVGTYAYMMVPQDFKTGLTAKATAPSGKNVKNVYLHGHKKEADYVRFIYDVDKNKMDELFESANSSTLSISTSYITDRPTKMIVNNNLTEAIQTEYRLQAGVNGIVIPKGAKVIFALPKDSRSVFKAGLANNYERVIGNLQTKRPDTEMRHSGVDPSDFGKAYTVAPYFGTEGGHVLTVEAGLTVPAGDEIILTVFDSNSPETVTMTIDSGGNLTTYNLTKHAVNDNRLFTMPNANVRSGVIINRSANTPHVNEFFTDSTTITGHSKYSDALVSGRTAPKDPAFNQAFSAKSPEDFAAEGVTLTGGHVFFLDIPATVQLKKDMPLYFSNAASGYFRSKPSVYRAQAKVTFEHNDGTDQKVERIVPINEKAHGDTGYKANGFEGNNILKINGYLSDYEGKPIKDTASQAYTDRQFYNTPPARTGYKFLGWSTKKADSMGATAFNNLPELTDVSDWDKDANYRVSATSPVDQHRTVYAVWEKDLYQYNIVLHANNGTGNTHTMELTVASVLVGLTELTAYHDLTGFGKDGRYFVGWSEEIAVNDGTLVHELYTNGSKIQLYGNNFQLQLNEEPVEPVTHINDWQTVKAHNIANEDGIATLNLYAQYKPLIKMTATKEWYKVIEDEEGNKTSQKDDYEKWVNDPTNNPKPEPDQAHFPNSNVAMVLMRTTEGKSLDPTKYEIIESFYKQGTDGAEWGWPLQEGHDPNGRKYSYLMTEFNALNEAHTPSAIVEHFNNKKTWASMYIIMIGQSDNLSKYTAISFVDSDSNTKSYMAVATSNQPDAEEIKLVNSPVNYAFKLRNFEVDVLPAIIHRIQTNHTEIVINSPVDGAKYLYVRLDDKENTNPAIFVKNDQNKWVLQDASLNKSMKIEEKSGKLIISSSDGYPPLTFENRAGERVYALFSSQNVDQDINKYASREIKAYVSLPNLEDVKQEPHIKGENGTITHHVISATIPAGTYAGADYTLGYMAGDTFVPVKDNEDNEITVTPDSLGKVAFNVPESQRTEFAIRGTDSAKMYKDMDPIIVSLDLAGPTITATPEIINIQTGDPVAGLVTADDISGVTTLHYKVTKIVDGLETETALPESITFDPVTGTISGKTADVLDENQLGTYTVTITAEDFYGNVSTKTVTLTITQRPTTDSITSITQIYNDKEGDAAITIQGTKGAVIKFYTKNDDGTFTEVDIPDVSGSKITNVDGTITRSLPKAQVFRFTGNKVYVTQQIDGELESDKVDVAQDKEIIDRAGNNKFSPGGSIIIDNEPPVPIQMVVPKAGTGILKFANVTANHSLPDVRDIDRIDLKIGDYELCDLMRQYDDQGEPTGLWKCTKGYTFEESEAEVTVIVNPNTGETAKRKVGVLTFVLPNEGVFEEYQVIKAKYYDYLGNISVEVTTSVPPIPRPVAPYDLTAVNDSQAHPKTTIITGKADPGAGVSVKVGKMLYAMIADEHGDFTLVIPKQAPGTELTLTSTLNGFTATATVAVTNVQADDYKPTVDPVEIPFGEAPTEEDIKNAIRIPDNYPEEWEKPVITVDVSSLPDGKTPGDYEVVVEVAYPDESKDVIKVPVRALRKVVPRDAAIDSQIPKNYVRVYFDPTDDGWLQYNPTFDPDTTIAFDVWKGLTWMEAVANGMIVPTATHVDSAYTFDKWIWHQTLSGTTVLNNETHRYYYMVASYKPVEEKPTTPTTDPVPPAPTDPKPSEPTDSVVITGESPAGLILATVFILLGAALVIAKRKTKHVK